MNETKELEPSKSTIIFTNEVENDEPSFPEQLTYEMNDDYRLFCQYMTISPGRTIKKAWDNRTVDEYGVSRGIFNKIAKRNNWVERANKYDIEVARYLAYRKLAMLDLAHIEITTGLIEASMLALKRVFEILQLPLSQTTKISDANELIKTIMVVHAKFIEGNGKIEEQDDTSLLLEAVLKISKKTMSNLNEIKTD